MKALKPLVQKTPLQINSACPHCGSTFDQMSGLNCEVETPNAGDYVLCSDCAEISVVGPDGGLCMISPEAMKELRACREWPIMETSQAMIRALIKKTPNS